MDESTPWMRLLRELFGDRAEDAVEEMRRMGMDPATLAEATGVTASPAMMDHLLAQIRSLIAQGDGQDVNWALAHDVARGVAAGGGDSTVSAAQAQLYRAAVSRAELWLDVATAFNPSTLTPHVWSAAEWVEATLPTWRVLAGPVASSVSTALGDMLGPVDADASGLLGSVSPTVCGMHVGQAAGTMAREAFGGTDLGIPLLPEPRVTLVPRNVIAFADGLDVPVEDVQAFIALREAAHVRLFQGAPWLAGQLHAAIERYAAGVTIDPEALDTAVREAGAGDPAKLQQALSRGIFAPTHTSEQEATLDQIATLLALIEGWVEEVSTAAGAPHLASIGPLREMMRRRRAAGGPAEHTFATLLGLELRPRRLRDASALWSQLTQRVGVDLRDAVWSHPDLLPQAKDLDDAPAWVARYNATNGPDAMDAALERLLSGDDTTEPT